MPAPLMPKATAVWLVENTSLTFDQIADFCGLHALEVQAIADGEVAMQMQGLDPVANGQTTTDEIERCQKDPDARLKLSPQAVPEVLVKHRGPRYTPIAKRQDKPDAIARVTNDRWYPRPHALEHAKHQAASSGDARPLQPRRARRRHRQGQSRQEGRGSR